MLEMLNSSGRLPSLGPMGQVTWTIPGTYQWVCPPGVKEICALVVGAGARGYTQGLYAYAGQGGQVRWRNKYPVQAGNTYTIVVGNAGDQSITTSTAEIPYSPPTSSVAFGLTSAYGNQGGVIVRNENSGGGHAGGTLYVGTGLGIGGNAANINTDSVNATAQKGGEGINIATTAKIPSPDNRTGVAAGGGGAAIPKAQNGGTLNKVWPGGHGAVRIIWGEGRAYPATQITNITPMTPGSAFISMPDLALAVGVTAESVGGTAINQGDGWYHWLNADGSELYIAERPIRHSITWEAMDALGIVNGTKTIVVKGRTFKVRFLLGATADPSSTLGREWNKYILPLFDGTLDSKTSDQLGIIGTDMGKMNMLQEVDPRGGHCAAVYRDINEMWYQPYNQTNPGYGWRPVLELVP